MFRARRGAETPFETRLPDAAARLLIRSSGPPVKYLLILLARGWQLGPSRVLPPTCRYQPSCSEYAIQALEKHGAIKGGWIAVRRLLRCHPWGGHGYDPVP